MMIEKGSNQESRDNIKEEGNAATDYVRYSPGKGTEWKGMHLDLEKEITVNAEI